MRRALGTLHPLFDALSDPTVVAGLCGEAEEAGWHGAEYAITGEEVDDRRRASMLDESLEILASAWSGEAVHHRGERYTVDGACR